MKLAIIGLKDSGKTTVFSSLTGSEKNVGSFGKLEAHISVVKVPDPRMDWLSEHYMPKKIVPASIEFIDIPGNINDSTDPKIIATAREADALVFVVRNFSSEEVLHPLGNIDPVRDVEQIFLGLILSDLSVACGRKERLDKLSKKGALSPEETLELSALEKVISTMEMEKPAISTELDDNEVKSLRSFQFLSMKKHMVIINVSDDAIKSEDTRELLSKVPGAISLSAKIEMELQSLSEEDRGMFIEDLGIPEPSINQLIRTAYNTLGLISFFTAGDKEVHAWTIKKGLTAPQAAGKIHSDLERGFIRAETFSFQDLKDAGSEQTLKKTGKFRLEGKDYIVRDGDILNIKFNV